MRIKLYDQKGNILGYLKVENIGHSVTFNGVEYEILHREVRSDVLTKVVVRPVLALEKEIVQPRDVGIKPKDNWLKSLWRKIRNGWK